MCGYHHEIMDRIHIINCMIDDHLIEHHGMTTEMNALCENAQSILCDVYQKAGAMCED